MKLIIVDKKLSKLREEGAQFNFSKKPSTYEFLKSIFAFAYMVYRKHIYLRILPENLKLILF